MMLTYRRRHELPDAFIESAVNGRAPREALTRSLLTDGHFRKNCGSIEIDLDFLIDHSHSSYEDSSPL
jgi:hypothetical protein